MSRTGTRTRRVLLALPALPTLSYGAIVAVSTLAR
jgi:hypothetical protein